LDGDFESGTPSLVWTEGSTNYHSPLCTPYLCGDGPFGGVPSGLWWVWFGGTPDKEEHAAIEQIVTVPTSLDTLSFKFSCGGNNLHVEDTFKMTIDGEVRLFVNFNVCEAKYPNAWFLVNIELGANVTDGRAHSFRWESNGTNTPAGAFMNFNLDEIKLLSTSGSGHGIEVSNESTNQSFSSRNKLLIGIVGGAVILAAIIITVAVFIVVLVLKNDKRREKEKIMTTADVATVKVSDSPSVDSV